MRREETESVTPEQHRRRIRKYRLLRWGRRIAFAAMLGAAMLVIIIPLYWMVATAVRPTNEIFTRPVSLIPTTLTLENLYELFNTTAFLTYYLNSIKYSVGVVVLTTVASTLGGYGLARLDIRFKRLFARSILFGYMFPAILLAIPMFILWREIGLINSYIGVVAAETALALPFSLWLMWQFFQTVPPSLSESAQTLGATRFQAFYEVELPMAKPGMIAVAVFSYAVSWDVYTIPLIIVQESAKWPLTVGVNEFRTAQELLWGQVMTASALILLPSFLFVYLLQTHLLRGFRLD